MGLDFHMETNRSPRVPAGEVQACVIFRKDPQVLTIS